MISKGFYFSSKIEKNKGDRDFKWTPLFIEQISIWWKMSLFFYFISSVIIMTIIVIGGTSSSSNKG